MMKADRITLRQFRAFEATIRHGSIAAAAGELNVTAPAISLQLKQLSESVGLSLYERSPEGLVATAAGRELVAAATRIERTLSALDQALSYLAQGDVGRVSIGAVSTAKYFVPRLVAGFTAQSSGVDIDLIFGNRNDIITALNRNDIDFAIMGRPPKETGYEKIVIGEHPQIIIASPTHHLAHRKNIPLSDLSGDRFLMREKGSGTRKTLQDLLRSHGLSDKGAITFDSNETIKQSVMAGMGVALISGHTVKAELRDGRLIALNVATMPIIRHWFLVKNADKIHMPSATNLWNFITGHVEQILTQI